MPNHQDDSGFFALTKARLFAAFSSAKTTFLTVTTALFVASALITPLREANVISSPIGTMYLPVLTALIVVVAVVFARGGKLSVKSKGVEVLLEELKEKDVSERQVETWLEGASRKEGSDQG